MNREKFFHGHCTFIYHMRWSGCTLHGIWRLVNIKWEKICLDCCLYIYLDFHWIQWTPDLGLKLQLQHGHICCIETLLVSCICIVGGGLVSPPAHDLTAARNFVPSTYFPPVFRAKHIFFPEHTFLEGTRDQEW